MRAARVAPLLAVAALCACAPEAPPAEATSAVAPGAGADGTAVLDDLGRSLSILGDKMVALAEAIPAETYAWRPMDGVRSVDEVFAHTAADNWFVRALFGQAVPAETGITTEGETVGAYERKGATKEERVAALRASFAALNEALEATKGAPGQVVRLRENELTTADLWVRAVVHLHEHLGQSIAYARMNGVVPPWSRADEG